ncbi:MAG: response regulator transcription factor [Actinobacteria bacterium]|nr:response regulator transcription factor [Actinomycetota bacterium]
MSLPCRVIVADDEPDVRYMLRLVLGLDKTFQVVGEAASGLETIALVKAGYPDLVLLDLTMPGTDGFEVIRMIHDEVLDTKIIVLSGLDDLATSNGALRAGASACLSKSATPLNLLIQLKKFCVG